MTKINRTPSSGSCKIDASCDVSFEKFIAKTAEQLCLTKSALIRYAIVLLNKKIAGRKLENIQKMIVKV
jgi:hypothetical protein